MDNNTEKKEEMYNRIKAEYANTSKHILEIIKMKDEQKKNEGKTDRGEEK